MEAVQYIPIDQCKNSFLYIIEARNSDIGVYIADKKAFKISRTMFNSNVIDYEGHCDMGGQHGTAKPLKEVERVRPMDDEVFLLYLNNKKVSCMYDIKLLKGGLIEPIVLINPERMRRLRRFHNTQRTLLC